MGIYLVEQQEHFKSVDCFKKLLTADPAVKFDKIPPHRVEFQ